MKKLILAFAIISSAICVNAQKMSSSSSMAHPTSFSIGVDAASPMGTFRSAGYKFGIGGHAAIDHKVASDLSLTLSAGYISFSNGGTAASKNHENFLPVLGGIKYWFTPKFFAHGALGASFNNYSTTTTLFRNGTGFAYTAGVGALVTSNIGLGVKYFHGDNLRDWIGASLSYKFGGK